MLRLLRFGFGLALAWLLYWAGAGWALHYAVSSWFQAQQDRGWQAEYSDLTLDGFPNRHITHIAAPALADPATGVAWQTTGITLNSPAIWPGHIRLSFPSDPQLFSSLDQTTTLQAQDMAADLRLRPSLALQLDHLSLTSGPWSLTAPQGPLIAADTLILAKQQQAETLELYQIDLTAERLTPGTRLRDLARLSRSLPPAFDTFTLSAKIRWDKPWDLSALETARPQPRHVDLKLAEAQWGPLRLLAAGEFSVDAEGIPEGVITIKAENWRDMLAMAAQSGAMPPEAVAPAERAFALLETLGGNPNALDLRLNFQGGAMALGPIPLGPAPRLILN